MMYHLKITIFIAVKNRSILHRHVCVMSMFFFLRERKLNKLSDFKHFDGGDDGSSFILQTFPCIMQRLLKAVKC